MSFGKETQKNNIIHNINGYTVVNQVLRTFNSMVFGNDGLVKAIGNLEDLKHDYPYAKRIDGENHTLLPGLIDAHGHILGLGYTKMEVNLSGTDSLDSALRKIKDYRDKNPDANWITGRGWNHALWNHSELPVAANIDRIVSDQPVWLKRIDSHAGWANSLALKLADISGFTNDPEGGKIIRDENGNPTGILIDKAMHLVDKVIPPHTKTENAAALNEALKIIRSFGLTSVHDPGIFADEYELYKEFVDKGQLTLRINAMILGVGTDFNKLSQNGPVYNYKKDLLALRSVKLFTDGALGSRGAALLGPYSDESSNCGILFYTNEGLIQSIEKAVVKGFQVNIHAIGDRANRQVLDCFEKIGQERDIKYLRNRIEHAQVVTLEDIQRFKKLEIIASVQPTHATSDMHMAEKRLGEKRLKGAYAWQKFEQQGTVVAGGSDFPVESPNPFLGLYAAVTRQNTNAQPSGGWYPEEKLTRLQAFKAFTINAAYAAHQEKMIGSLEPGKWADFILVDSDFFEIPEENIWKTKVLQTWLAGEKIYQYQES